MAVLNRSALADAANWVAGFIPSRPAVPILSGLRVSYLTTGKLIMEAYDYEVAAGAAISTEDDGGEAWTVIVPGSLFAQIVKGGQGKEVSLRPVSNGLAWGMGRAMGVLHVMALEEYPSLPEPSKATAVATLSRQVLQAKVAQATNLCGDSDWQAGVLLESTKNGFWVKAGSKYAVQRSRVAAGIGKLAAYLLPHKQLGLALKMPGDVIDISSDRDRVWFSAGDEDDQRTVAMPTMAANFPVVDPLFTAERPVNLTLDGEALIEALKSVALVTNSVQLETDFGDLMVTARKPFGGGELQSDVTVKLDVEGSSTSEEVRAGMQLTYLLAAVKGNAGRVDMSVATSGNHSWLVSEGDTETVIMGLRD